MRVAQLAARYAVEILRHGHIIDQTERAFLVDTAEQVAQIAAFAVARVVKREKSVPRIGVETLDVDERIVGERAELGVQNAHMRIVQLEREHAAREGCAVAAIRSLHRDRNPLRAARGKPHAHKSAVHIVCRRRGVPRRRRSGIVRLRAGTSRKQSGCEQK